MSHLNGTNEPIDLTGEIFLDAEQVGKIFLRDKRWAWRQARPGRFLSGAVRRFGTGDRKIVLFSKAEIARLVSSPETES